MTAVALPMVHDSYLSLKEILPKMAAPYLRLPGIEDIKRTDIVVLIGL
jgi:signal peptidase I